MNAIDTNVFVYLHDSDEQAKQATARALIDSLLLGRDTVLLWQAVVELLSCFRKWQATGKMADSDVEANCNDVLAMFPLRMPTPDIIRRSFELRAKFSLSHWDSLLLAACHEAGVDTLYSEDLDSNTDYEGLRVLNPFANGMHSQ